MSGISGYLMFPGYLFSRLKSTFLLVFILAGWYINAQVLPLEQNADDCFNTFHYDSAATYYKQSAQHYALKQDWLNCVKNYRLTGNSFLEAGKRDSALIYSKYSLKLSDSLLTEHNKETITEKIRTLLNMGNISNDRAHYSEQLKYSDTALVLYNSMDSPDELLLAKIQDNTGNAYFHLDKNKDALDYFKKGLEIRLRLCDSNSIELAESYTNLSNTYQSLSDYDESFRMSLKAIKNYELKYGNSNPYIIENYSTLAINYIFLANYQNASYYFHKAMQIQSILYDTLNSNEFKILYNFTNLLIRKGEYDTASLYMIKIMNIYDKFFDESHPSGVYINLLQGYLYREEGDYNSAKKSCINSLRLYYLLPDKPEDNLLFRILGILAQLSMDIGEFDNSLACNYYILNNMRFVTNEDKEYSAGIYGQIGTVYNSNCEYAKAIKYYQMAIDNYVAIHKIDNPYSVTFNDNIGNNYSLLGKPDIGLEYFNHSLPLLIKSYGKIHPSIEVNYYFTGYAYFLKCNYNEAFKYYSKSLKMLNTLFGINHPDIAKVYNRLGELFSAQKIYDRSLDYYHKAILANMYVEKDSSVYSFPISNDVLSKPQLIESLAGKANTFLQLYLINGQKKDLEASLHNFELAFELIHKLRNDYSFESKKILLSENTKSYYVNAARAAIEYHKLYPDSTDNKLPVEYMELCKSSVLSAYFNESNAEHMAAIPDSLLKQEKRLKINLNVIATERDKELFKSNGYDTLRVKNLEIQYFNYSQQYDSLLTLYKTNYKNYFQLKYSPPTFSLNHAQAALDTSSALVSYFLGDTTLIISVITQTDYQSIAFPIDSSFKNNVLAYYKSIRKFDPIAMDSLSPLLYNKLISPIAERLKNKPHLIIIPDEYLYYVPFEALCAESKNHDYLIKTHSISYHHSATLWYNSKMEENKAESRKEDLVAFAPVFSKKSNTGVILASNVQVIDTTGNDMAYRSVSADRKNFNPLPGSESEIEDLVKLFEKYGKEAKGYLYSEASEENFKTRAKGYKIVHIATHGFSNDKEPMLSGLAFSQPSDTGNVTYDSIMFEYKVKGEDGILYAGEAYNLDLNADLVVLSSCDGGIGKLSKGEGLLSMTRGFLYSGTPNIIYSLYKVSDKHTQELMIDFYTGVLAGKSYADALRQAKLNMINNEATSSPFFWSGFVLLGR